MSDFEYTREMIVEHARDVVENGSCSMASELAFATEIVRRESDGVMSPLKIPVWLIIKKGEARHFVHPTKPSDSWLASLRKQGFEVFCFHAVMPDSWGTETLPDAEVEAEVEEKDDFICTVEDPMPKGVTDFARFSHPDSKLVLSSRDSNGANSYNIYECKNCGNRRREDT